MDHGVRFQASLGATHTLATVDRPIARCDDFQVWRNRFKLIRKLLKHRDLKFTHTTVSHFEIC